jgi:integrase
VKTGGSERTVALPASLVEVLRAHRALQRTEREVAGDRWQDHGLRFTTKIGTPVEPRNINRHFEQLCERPAVRRIRVHDLRHSCATLLYDQDVPLERIQDVLGHSSPTVTKSIYVEPTRRVQQDAVDRLGFLFDA